MSRAILVLLFLATPLLINAQTKKEQRFVTRGESIEEVLNRFVNQYNVDLVYDPELDLNDPVFVDITSPDPNVALRQILRGSEFDFIILSSGTYVITQRQGIVQRYGKFIGYVYDDETGEPIENASILFADASVSTFTNENGYFSVSPLDVGNYPVTISSMGYSPQKRTVSIEQKAGVNIIRLSPSTFIGDPVIVNGNSVSLSNGKYAENIDASRLNDAIGASQPSLIRSMNNFSGISFNHSQNELSIQGGDPSNYLIRLDGVNLYNTSRAGGIMGMFSPYSIDKISIQKSAYDASYGGSLSGSIDFSQDINDRSPSNYLIQADPNSLNLRTELQSSGSPWRASVTGRFQQLGVNTPYYFGNTLDEWNQLDPLMQNFLMGSNSDIAHYHASVQENDLNFNDVHVIAEYSPDDFSTTTISGYFGNQQIETKLLSERTTLTSGQPDFVYSQENTDTYNLMGQISHYQILNPQTDIEAQLSVSKSRYQNIYYMDGHNTQNSSGSTGISTSDSIFRVYQNSYSRDESLSDLNEITDLTLSSELTQYFSSMNKTRFGIELKYIDYNFELKDLFYFPTNNDTRFGLITAYASNKLSVSRNLWIEAGIRSTYSSSNQSIYLLPRLSLTLDTDKTMIGYQTLSIKGGVYRQFFNQFDVANVGPSALVPYNRFSTPVDASIDAPVSYQTAFSWSLMPSDLLRFTLDGFYKHEPNSYEINYLNILTGSQSSGNEIMEQSEFLTTARMEAYGGAFSVDTYLKDPNLHIKLVQQSNISRQKIEGRFNNDWNHSAWSEPFSTSLFMDLRLTSKLALIYNMKWIPRRYWAFNRTYYDFLSTHNESMVGGYDFNNPDAFSLDDYFRMDLGANYTFDFESFTMKARVDLTNLTNRKNEISYQLTPIERNNQIEYQLTKRTLPGFIPSASLQIEF